MFTMFNVMMAWLPPVIRILVGVVFVLFLVWVITGIVKRILDVIPFV